MKAIIRENRMLYVICKDMHILALIKTNLTEKDTDLPERTYFRITRGWRVSANYFILNNHCDKHLTRNIICKILSHQTLV